MTAPNDAGFDIEYLGTATTNTTPDSQHPAIVTCPHLWSYAQEAALLAVSEKAWDHTYRLIDDPERRAQRIAGHYADLYFRSKEKSGRSGIQFYWVALAAFVVKDIVYAFRYTREDVLQSSLRSADVGQAAGAYAHAMRTYLALAKGNLWLFMDIYPWLWFYLEYIIENDGTLNTSRLTMCAPQRDSATYQRQSKGAVQWLPFGRNWLNRINEKLADDPVYTAADQTYRDTLGSVAAFGNPTISAEYSADRIVRQKIGTHYPPHLMPVAHYWPPFKRKFFALDEWRREMQRVVQDTAALGRLERIQRFGVKPEIMKAYEDIGKGFLTPGAQRDELMHIAKHEQINVLQPLIYDDPKLKETLDLNHSLSRRSTWLSPPFQVVFNANKDVDDPELKVRFDPPHGVVDWIAGSNKSLANPQDRMKYVGDIAKQLNKQMAEKKDYMEAELEKIRAWKNA